MVQFFSSDKKEIKLYGAAREVFEFIFKDLQTWYNNAYESKKLGEVIYDNKLTPIASAMTRDAFIHSFNEIFEQWQYLGVAESYILVFKKIFGAGTQVELQQTTQDTKGQVIINIALKELQTYNWLISALGRGYVDRLVDAEGQNNIVLQEAMTGYWEDIKKILHMLVPAGIYLKVNFSILQGD
jgi:hypothetical protein